MRKTIFQLVLLLMAGAVVVWKEWTVVSLLDVPTKSGLTNTNLLPMLSSEQIAETSSSFIIWLVLIGCMVVGLVEWLSRYFKLSSPNSV